MHFKCQRASLKYPNVTVWSIHFPSYFFSFAVLNREITESLSPVLKKILGIKHEYLDWFSSALGKVIGLRLSSSVSVLIRYAFNGVSAKCANTNNFRLDKKTIQFYRAVSV